MSLFKKLKLFLSHTNLAIPETTRLLESVFQSSENAYLIYSSETLEVIKANRKAYEFFELHPEKKLEGLYISQVMMRYLAGDSPNLETLMNDIREDWTGEALFKTHKKNKFYGFVNTNILPAGNMPAFRVLSITNINAIKRNRDDIDLANRELQLASHAKARFLSTMSHELRTPLNGIIGTAEFILSSPAGLPNEIREHIGILKYSSEHMLDIVNDILEFSKIDAGKMKLNEKAFNLQECLNKIISAFSLQFREQGIRLATVFSDEELKDLEVITDETKLNQILKNLLSNAYKFTNEGEVSLNVEIRELTDSLATIYFEVSDTGIGIPEEKQDEIFQAFSQVYNDDLKRRFDGSGLGLTISNQLVTMMGGRLEVESKPEEGSRFFFTFQLKVAPKKENIQVLPDVSAPKKDIRGIRTLVVEDNEINASILRSFLNRWKMPVKEAITGVHALELIKYHKFDLILMDLEMPEMNGYTALKKIREQHIDVPVIAFTATLLDDMGSLITEAGFTDYVLKPFKPADLRKKIEKYCERKIDYV